jgi:hypothetical protein
MCHYCTYWRRLSNGGWERASVNPNLSLLDDVPIDSARYAMIKVDTMNKNVKNLKSEVSPDNTTLTLQDTVTRRVQWRRTDIDVDQAASSSTTPEPPPQSPNQTKSSPCLL